MSPSDPSGPLAGYRVIDLSTIVLGPYASLQLADMGADVIKVEAPPGGDAFRDVKPARNAGMSGPFINLNRNKRSIVLDLKQTAGRAVLERLIAGADVFFHNMRPRAIAGLDLGYEQVAGLRPDIVYCGAQGYGRRGPYRDRPAYDDIVQGESGLAGLNARIAGAPTYAPTIIADKLVGMAASQAMVMALLHRERTGQGQEVEVPMFETMAAFILAEHLSGRVFEPPLGNTGYGRVASPYRRPYKARDGYVCVLPYTDDQWRRFFALAGRSELSDDPRFDHMSARSDNIDELYELLEQIIAGRSVGEWLELFGRSPGTGRPHQRHRRSAGRRAPGRGRLLQALRSSQRGRYHRYRHQHPFRQVAGLDPPAGTAPGPARPRDPGRVGLQRRRDGNLGRQRCRPPAARKLDFKSRDRDHFKVGTGTTFRDHLIASGWQGVTR